MTAASDVYEGMYIPKGEFRVKSSTTRHVMTLFQVPSCLLAFGVYLVYLSDIFWLN